MLSLSFIIPGMDTSIPPTTIPPGEIVGLPQPNANADDLWLYLCIIVAGILFTLIITVISDVMATITDKYSKYKENKAKKIKKWAKIALEIEAELNNENGLLPS